MFDCRRGTISVFLTLILLPTVVFAGLMTDAVRIYQSQGLVSEAGELAMNAGLSCYNTELKDHYGMLVMHQTPEEMRDALEQYFVNTIQASGLDGAENVSSLLDLRSREFEAKSVPGSEIYMPEVEKQQILEYMKYRAPVCIGEELLEKIEQIKNTQKQADAVEAQMDFSETMEDLQDACEAANKAIREYCAEAEDKTPEIAAENINPDIDKAEAPLVKAVRYLFMVNIFIRYEESDDAEDFMESMRHYNEFAEGIEDYLSADADQLGAYFEAYLTCLYYDNHIPTRNLEALVEQKKQAVSKGEAEELQKTYDAYLQNSVMIDNYIMCLKYAAEEYLNEAWSYIGSWHARVLTAQERIDTAIAKLDALKAALGSAQNAHGGWKGKIDLLSAGEQKTNMNAEAAEYEHLLSEEKLDALRQKLEHSKNSLNSIRTALEANTFCGFAMTTVLDKDRTDEIGQKISGWGCRMPRIMEDGSAKIRRELEDDTLRFVSANYVKTAITGDCGMASIRSDDFYKQLQAICKKNPETPQAKEDKQTTDDLLQKASAALEPITDIEDIDWGASVLPSVLLSQNGADDGKSYALPDDANTGKSGRKKAIASAKNTVRGLSGFLDELNRLAEETLENLYLTEYGMQMFSYYTVNKKVNGETISVIEDPRSISGDKLSDNMLYRSEVEYMLWGKQNAQKNVENTRLLLYGIRMVTNLIYAFSDSELRAVITPMATAMSCGIPFLVPVFSVLLRVAVAGAETVLDVGALMRGEDVPLFKNGRNGQIRLRGMAGRSGTDRSVKVNYREYLTIFLFIRTLGSAETKTLVRIADCIQLNTETDLTKGYTMLAVSARVESRTTFLKKAAALPDGGAGAGTGDWYTIKYQSALGY